MSCRSRRRAILLVNHCKRHVAMLVCRAYPLALSVRALAPKHTTTELRNNPRASDGEDQLSANRAIAHLFPGGRRDNRRNRSVVDPLAPEVAAYHSGPRN